MALFNFIETFFFISLAITFLLILLLVYHFKQRLGTLEQKTETMFEIVNNVVKELNNMRNIQQKLGQFSAFPPQQTPPSFGKQPIPQFPKTFTPAKSPLFNENLNLDDAEQTNKILVSIVDKPENIYVEEVKDDEDDDDEEDDDFEDEYDEATDDEDDSVMDDSVVDEDIVIDYTEMTDVLNQDSAEETPETETIKIINIENSIDETEIDAADEQEQEVLHVDKLEDNDTDTANPSQQSTELNSTQDYAKEIYRKMNLNTLKTLVITKGLCSDPSKMKKPDLLKLLEASTIE